EVLSSHGNVKINLRWNSRRGPEFTMKKLHEVKRLKQSRIPIIKVRWNSRRGPEFT
ncbi:hypothetical protein Tco_1427020, partial [Tanacetum coccineum]